MDREQELAKLIAEQKKDDTTHAKRERMVVMSLDSHRMDGGITSVKRDSNSGRGCTIHGRVDLWVGPQGDVHCRVCRRDRERLRYKMDAEWRKKKKHPWKALTQAQIDARNERRRKLYAERKATSGRV